MRRINDPQRPGEEVPAPSSWAMQYILGQRRRSPTGLKAAAPRPDPTRDPQPRETEQQRGPRQVDPVADQHYRTAAAGPQQPRSLLRILDGVA